MEWQFNGFITIFNTGEMGVMCWFNLTLVFNIKAWCLFKEFKNEGSKNPRPPLYVGVFIDVVFLFSFCIKL